VIAEFDPNKFYKKNLKLHEKKIKKSGLKLEIIEKYQLYKIPSSNFIFKKCSDVKSYQKLNLFKKYFLKRAYQHVQIGKHFNVEYRFPMLDVRLLEFIYNLPESTIMPNRKTRYLYQKTVNVLVPQAVINKHKSTVYTTPFAGAFMKNQHEKLSKHINEISNPNFNTYFDISKINYYSDFDLKNRKYGEKLKYYFFRTRL
jgi:asparagine synthase (glutamine-hydrolysing)